MDQKSSDLTNYGANQSGIEFTSDGGDSLDKIPSNADVQKSAAADTSHETEQIKAQIEETRTNLGETIDAIQERLSFSNISEQVSEQVNNAIESAKDSVYEATIGKAVNFMKNTGNELSHTSVVQTVRDNPIPFALIGLGSGLLVYNAFAKKSHRRNSSNYIPIADRSDVSETSLYQSAEKKISGAVETVSNAAGTAFEGVAHAASGTLQGVSNAAGNTYSGAREIASKAFEKAGEVGHAAHEKYDHYIEEKPLAIGAVALAVGAAVGFAIPSTRYEGELMGEARSTLLTKAEATATDFVDKAKQVASEAGRTLKDEVKTATDEYSSSR